MIRYDIVKNGVVKNSWYSTQHGADYYEPCFGSVDEYQLVQTDVTGTAADPRMRSLRNLRNKLLADTDWTQLMDCPLGDVAKAAWTVYRQALRDLPQSDGFDADNIVWPAQP